MTDTFSMATLIWIGVGLISVVLSALYSGMETGIYCLNRVRLHVRGRSPGGRSARLLENMLSDQTRLLIVLLIGNNVTNYATTAAAAVLLAGAGLGFGRAELLVTLLVTPILFVWGEMVPKTLFRRHADTLVYRWAWMLRGSALLLSWIGVVALVRAISAAVLSLVKQDGDSGELLSSRQKIRSMLIETAHGGSLTLVQSEIAENVLALSEVRLRDVMVPIFAVRSLEESVTRDRFLAAIRKDSHTRHPVCRAGRPRQIVGVVHVLDGLLLSEEEWSLTRIMTRPTKLSASTTVQSALSRLQQARQSMGIVVDANDRCLGIVTIKDLVEEIVGELRAW